MSSMGRLLFMTLLLEAGGAYAGLPTVVDKDHIAQIAMLGAAGSESAHATLIVRYKVIAAAPQESSTVQIALVSKALDISGARLSREQQQLLNAHTIGLISHYPPAQTGSTGEVRLVIPQAARQTLDRHFLLFHMVPAQPRVPLEKSRLEIVSIGLAP